MIAHNRTEGFARSLLFPMKLVAGAEFLQLTFAIKLLTYIELGKIPKGEFDSDLLVRLKRRNLCFRERTFRS